MSTTEMRRELNRHNSLFGTLFRVISLIPILGNQLHKYCNLEF